MVSIVALGMLIALPAQSPDAEGARIVMTFDDGTESKIVEFTTDPLPGERATVYLKLRGDVTVTQAAINLSAVLLERSWQVGGPGLTLLGYGIDVSGDYTGDGYTDMLITAPGATTTAAADGFLTSVRGGANGFALPQDIIVTGGAANDMLGWGLCTSDINEDGRDDVIAGQIEMNFGTETGTGPGSVLIWWGSTRVNATADITLSQGADGDMFGYSVSSTGDLNGDGHLDLVIGAPRNVQNTNNPGKAYIYYGNGNSTLPSTANVTLLGTDNGDGFGRVVHICGDVNGDGYDDVYVGAPGHNGTSDFDVGKAYVFFGGASGVDTTADWTYEGKAEEDYLGFSGVGLGDANGDAYGDLVIGVPRWDDGTTEDVGQALVFYGSSSGPSTTPDVTIEGDTSEGYLGIDIAHAGDINSDGMGDVVIGAPNTHNGSLNSAGHIQVHFGDSGGISSTPSKVLRGWSADGDMGFSVGPGGDGNGDGYDDICTGDITNEFTYVYYGGPDAKDPALYLDDTLLWSRSGSYPGTDRTDDFADELNAYIQAHQGDVDVNGDLLVPLNISMSAAGKLKLNDIVVQFYRLVKPTGLVATPVPAGDAIKLTWDDHTIKSDDISKMAIEMWNGTGWEEVEKVAKNAKEYTVTGLTDGVQYQFRLRAFDGAVQAFSEASDVAMATPSDTKAPGKVLNVMALEDRDVMGINISWDLSDADTVNYEIWSNKTGTWEMLANVSGDTTYYVDTDIEDGPWYWYRLRAWDEVPLIGEFSAVAKGRLRDLTGPAVPSNFQITTVASGRALRLTWDLNTDDTVAYSLESNKTGPWKEVVLVGRTVSEFIDTGLKDGTTYWYRLAARDESDNPSNYTERMSAVPVDATPPTAPVNLRAVARPQGEIVRLAWDLNVDDTTQYNVYMWDGSAFTMVAQVLALYDQYDVGSLVNGQTYRFRVKAQDAAGLESDWSNEVEGVPVDTFPPAIPGGLTFKLDPNGGAVNLTWTANTDDTVAYRVLQWNGPQSRWDQLAEVAVPRTYFTISGLNNNEPYAFVVRAVDEGGTESPNSQRVDVIPKDITAPAMPQFVGLPVITNQRDLTLIGTCQPGATITIIINNLRQDETAVCDAEGAFTLTVRLKNGPNDMTAEAVDDSGLTTTSSRYSVRLDTVAPQVTSTEPADGTRDVTRNNLTFEVYFSEDVKRTSLKAILREGRVDLAEMLLATLGATDNIVPRLVSYDQVRYKATFEVDDSLKSDSAYTILVYDVEDQAGNPLDVVFNGHTFQVWTVESSGGGGGGGGGGDDGIGGLGWIIAAIVIIVLVVVVAFVLVSRTGTHEEIVVDRSVLEGPSFDDEPAPDRPDIQQMYSAAYSERGEEPTEHHVVEGGLGDWLAEQERKSREADEEARRLMSEMQSTSAPQEDSGPIEEVPPDLLPESEYTAAYHMDTPAEEAVDEDAVDEGEADDEADDEPEDEADDEADDEPEDEADDDEAEDDGADDEAEVEADEEDDTATLLDELEEELESDKEE